MSPRDLRPWFRLAALAGACLILTHAPASSRAMAAGLFAAGAAAAAVTAASSERLRRAAAGLGAAALLAVLLIAAHREGLGRAQRAAYFLWLACTHLAFVLGPARPLASSRGSRHES